MIDRARMLAASREEVRRLKSQRLSEVTPSRRDFSQFVATQRQDLAVIARLRLVQSAAGCPRSTAELVAYAQACDDADVAALAVATGADGLSIEDMAAVAEATTAPILRDDLLIDPHQLYSSRWHGADAAVFPAAAMDDESLKRLVAIASSLHMAAVIEVLDEAGLDAALDLPHAVIGLRCTGTTNGIDLKRTRDLAQRVPRQRTIIALPGVHSAAECAALRGLCDAVTVDEALLTSDDISAALKRLTGA